MPNHDYHCGQCGWILRDQYRSIDEGGSANPPPCPICTRLMVWMIPVPRMDLRSDGEGKSGSAFQKFTVMDGQNHPVEIDSLHKLRQVERESEQLARDGMGQQMVFRAYANHTGNKLDPTLGDIPTPKLDPAAKRRFGLQSGAKPLAGGESGPDIAFGPGVNESNTSALKDA